MSIRSLERRLEEAEATLNARPLVFVVSARQLDAAAVDGAFAEARLKAGVAPDAPAEMFNIVTGVAR